MIPDEHCIIMVYNLAHLHTLTQRPKHEVIRLPKIGKLEHYKIIEMKQIMMFKVNKSVQLIKKHKT